MFLVKYTFSFFLFVHEVILEYRKPLFITSNNRSLILQKKTISLSYMHPGLQESYCFIAQGSFQAVWDTVIIVYFEDSLKTLLNHISCLDCCCGPLISVPIHPYYLILIYSLPRIARVIYLELVTLLCSKPSISFLSD